MSGSRESVDVHVIIIIIFAFWHLSRNGWVSGFWGLTRWKVHSDGPVRRTSISLCQGPGLCPQHSRATKFITMWKYAKLDGCRRGVGGWSLSHWTGPLHWDQKLCINRKGSILYTIYWKIQLSRQLCIFFMAICNLRVLAITHLLC